MRFLSSPELEDKFKEEYSKSSKTFVLMGTISGMAIIASFYSVDYLLFYPIYKDLFFYRSINLILAFILASYAFLINKKSNYLFWVSFIGPLMTGIVQTHILAIGKESVDTLYFPGIILVMMYNFCFLKQRFVHATVSSFIFAIYFNIIILNSDAAQGSEFLLMNMFLFSSIFIGLWVSYILEFSTRSQFLLTQKLESAIEDRKEIYRVVVHDLKNPVSVIKSQVHMLVAAGKIDTKYSKRIFTSTDRMLYLLDHLLKFCEIEDSEAKVEFNEYNIQEIMDICIENNITNAESKNIELIHKKDGHDFIALIDAFKTQEVIDNIISNAIKYSPLDSKVEVFYRESEEFFQIMIKDFGQGIKEDEISRVFDKFTKLSSTPTAGETSNGLGLSLSKNLMEIQGGNITCRSKYGAWTEFTIYIPKRDSLPKLG